jgi:diguanylate cyclase (GGDEF)-like protein
MAIWYLVVTPTVQSNEGSLLAEVLSLAYPVGDLVLVLGAARLLMRHRGPHLKVPLWCLVGGVLAFALADVAYAQLSLTDSYAAGTLPDALWIVGLCGLALAGWTQWRYGNSTSEATDEVDAEMPVSNLPYFAVAGGLGLVLYEATLDAGGSLIALVMGALALTGVVVWRQRVVMRENERLVAELHRTANTDALTGLLSRRRFLELAERVVNRSDSACAPVAVLMIDIDHFKKINDSLGHAGGDDAIREVAARCEAALRPGDLLGRLGGDELVAILPGITDEDTDHIATRLTRAVADAPVLTSRGPVSVTISIGASVADAPVALDQLLSDADTTLYAAKAAGRNQHLTHRRRSPQEETSPPVAALAAPR